MSRQEFLHRLFIKVQDIKNESKEAAKQFLSNHLKQLNIIDSSMKLESNSSFFTVAVIAVQKECKVVIELLIELGIDINAIDNNGNTLLHHCAYNYSFPLRSNNVNKIAKLLLKNNANPNVKNQYGKTPLHIVSQKHHKQVLKFFELLIQYHADVNAVDANRRTSLFYCIQNRSFYLTKFLLEHNADVNHPDAQGMTPIFTIPKRSGCEVEFYNLFFHHKVNIHTVNNKGQTLLHIFAEGGHIKLLQQAIDLGININAVDSEGKTALHVAAFCDFQVVRCLLQNNIDINILDKNDCTALFYFFMHIHSVECFSFDVLHFQIYCNAQRDKNNIIERIKRGIKMLKKHIIKMECAGLYIDRQNLYYSYVEYSKYFIEDGDLYLEQLSEYKSSCLGEIKKLKVNIGQSNVTFFDILTADISKLTKYARNDNILEILNSENLVSEYPLYIHMMKSHFARGTMRFKLLDIARACFISSCSSIVSSLCTDKIFKYLENHDLMNFIKASRPTSNFDF